MILYSYHLFTLIVFIISFINAIDLSDIESTDKIIIRKFPGYSINTFILTVSEDEVINHLANNKIEIWNGFDTERMVEAWAYEKAEKILLIDLFVVDYNGFRSNHNIGFVHGAWREIDFVKFHLILRDLRINSRPLHFIDKIDINIKYDPYRELDIIALRNGVKESEEEEQSRLTKILCHLVTCFM